MDGAIPPPVRERLLRPHGVRSAEPMRPGLSGAVIFHCRDGQGGQYALRRWPAGTRGQRIAEIHHVVIFARQQGCDIVPKLYRAGPATTPRPHLGPGELFHAEGDGYLWDLSDWMPGRPLDVDAPSQPITLGAVAIAAFHRATGQLGMKLGCPPAVIARIRRCKELDQQLPNLLRATATCDSSIASLSNHPDLARTVDAALQLLRQHWTAVSTKITRSMGSYEDIALPVQYVLRDVHREHLLFPHNQRPDRPSMGGPTGLIDFDALRMDTPMTDLARWVGSFSASFTEPTWEMAMAGYREHSPFSQAGQSETLLSLAKDLAEATHWISLANWVTWVVAERRIFPIETGDVAMRIAKLVGFCRSGNLGGLR